MSPNIQQRPIEAFQQNSYQKKKQQNILNLTILFQIHATEFKRADPLSSHVSVFVDKYCWHIFVRIVRNARC